MFWSSCPFCLVCRCSMLGPSVSKKSFELKHFLLCRVQSVKTGARQNRQKKSGGKDWDHSPKPTKMVRGRSQISTYLNQETLHSSNGKEGALRPPEVNGSCYHSCLTFDSRRWCVSCMQWCNADGSWKGCQGARTNEVSLQWTSFHLFEQWKTLQNYTVYPNHSSTRNFLVSLYFMAHGCSWYLQYMLPV